MFERLISVVRGAMLGSQARDGAGDRKDAPLQAFSWAFEING